MFCVEIEVYQTILMALLGKPFDQFKSKIAELFAIIIDNTRFRLRLSSIFVWVEIVTQSGFVDFHVLSA